MIKPAINPVEQANALRKENIKHNATAPGYRKRCVKIKKLTHRCRTVAKTAKVALLK